MSSIVITFFNNAVTKKCSDTKFTVADAVSLMTEKHLQNATRQYRNLEPGTEKDNAKKTLFPAVCWSVSEYKDQHRSAANCVKHSGLICIDIDKLTADRHAALIKLLANDPYTFILFTSPSAVGIKVIIKIEADAKKHKEYFHAIAEHYLCEYDVVIDASGKDVSRLCFLCDDPELYHNPDSQPFVLKPAKLIIEEPQKNYQLNTQQQQQLRKNTGITVNDVFEFTQNISHYTTGNHNNFIHLFACNCNRKGIDQNDALQFALSFATNKDGKEVKDTVNSAYQNNKHEFGKFAKKVRTVSTSGEFTPVQKNTKPDISGTITKTKNRIGAIGSEDDGGNNGHINNDENSSAEGEDNTTPEFWYEFVEEDKTGREIKKYSLDYIKYFDFLENQGFYRLPLQNNTFDLIRFKDNICTPQMPHNIQDHLNKWCKENEQLGVLAMLRKGAKTYFAGPQFVNLNYKHIEFARDTPTSAFFYFKNGLAEVTKDGINFHEYKQYNKAIWQSQIIDHDFVPVNSDVPYTVDGSNIDFDSFECEFARFISRAASNPKNTEVSSTIREHRYFSHMSSIGYMLHDFKTKISKAIIAVDHKMALDKTEQNGGTGKSIVGNSFKYLKKTALIDGREFKADYPFRFDMLESDTKIIVMQDCNYSLDFGSFFVPITGDFTYNRRNVGFRTIKYEDSPKFWFDTNFTFKGEGDSFKRRQHVIEFDDYYNENYTPYDDFGHYLFTDWDKNQMNLFYNFMLNCVQVFLAEGLIKYSSGNYDERKMVNECPQDFIDFMDAKDEQDKYLIARNRELLKTDLLKQWTDQCRILNMTVTSSHMFSKFVKKYCRTRGLILKNKKTNGKEYYALCENEDVTITAYQPSLF